MTRKDKNIPKSVANALRVAREKPRPWLRLGACRLNRIPEEIFTLTHLESIDLSENELRNIPLRLRDLPKLKSVNLIGNPIESLPDRLNFTIDTPTYLRCRNQINEKNIVLQIGVETSEEIVSTLVREVSRTKSLRGLILGTSHLTIGEIRSEPTTGIRKALDSLAKLDFLGLLSLRGLRLGYVPEGIRQLQLLKYLRLDALGLSALPEWISELSLETLSIMDNNLSAVPDSFHDLRHLKTLSMSWNPLKEIPALVFDLAALESLNITACEIREIPEDVLRLPRLKTLSCFDNPLESPPEEVANNG